MTTKGNKEGGMSPRRSVGGWAAPSARDRVQATDTELRALMSEVRKNRIQWASEDKVGQ